MKPRKPEELELMRKSGQMSAKAMKKVLSAIKPGVTLPELEEIVATEIRQQGGGLSFATVPGYHWATCVTVNDEVVHGLPTRDITLQEGDKVSIDLGALYKGWHTDTAWSVIVKGGTNDDRHKDKERFLAVGEEALWKGVKQAKEGNKVGAISEAIQTTIEGAGFQVVRALVGHGVGQELHEEPEVPGFGNKEEGIELKAGMTIAIEAIYTEGTIDVIQDRDGWTIKSEDGSLGGLFEMTVIVGKDAPEVITDWRKVT